jgi:hypothetical protein
MVYTRFVMTRAEYTREDTWRGDPSQHRRNLSGSAYDCGYAFVADAAAHRAAMPHRALYLTQADEARDQLDWNPECWKCLLQIT